VTILNPGASGYGDPYLREPEKVRIDVKMGFVSRPAAASEYGVIIDHAGAINAAATAKARANHVRDNYRAEFNFGPEREAWETVFDDKTMLELNRRLYALPKSVRQETRRRIFEKTVPDLPIPGGTPLTQVLADADAAKARLRRAMKEAFGPATLRN
jgi:N-methylhydantoinase B